MATEASYKGHRYPVEIISHCVWLYYRFALSLRDISEMMLERGVVVSHETVRQWCAKFGQGYANQLRRRRPRPGDKWHLDEVFIRINGKHHYCATQLGAVLHRGGPHAPPSRARRGKPVDAHLFQRSATAQSDNRGPH